jgi:hypothetical protein
MRRLHLLAGIEATTQFPSVDRAVRFYGISVGKIFIGVAVGGRELRRIVDALEERSKK